MDDQIFVLTHGNDLDGLGSAALIRRRYHVPLENIFFLDYGDDKLNYAVENILKRSVGKSIVFVADTGMSDGQILPFKRLILHIKKSGGKVFWFDHHHWKKNQIRDVAKICDLAVIGENEHACGAEITRSELGLNDKFSVKLAKMAHQTDFKPILYPYIRDDGNPIEVYGLGFSYYNNFMDIEKNASALRGVVAMLSSGKLLNVKIVKDARKFERITKKQLKILEKQTYVINKNVAIGIAEALNSNIACDRINSITRADITLYFDTTHSKGHLRSKKADILKLAINLGGGGHPHSAGFDLDRDKFGIIDTEESRLKLVGFVSKAVTSSHP